MPSKTGFGALLISLVVGFLTPADPLKSQPMRPDGSADEPRTPLGGAEVTVARDPEGRIGSPRLAVSPSGTTVVVWERFSSDGSLNAILGQLFAPDGRPLGTVIEVHADPLTDLRDPAVAFDRDSGFRVLWSEGTLGLQRRLASRPFHRSGTPAGPAAPFLSCATLPDPGCSGIQSSARLTRGSDGRWLIAAGYTTTDSRFAIVSVVLNPDGAVDVAHASTSGENFGPVVATDAADRSLIAWNDSERQVISGRLFIQGSEPVSDPFDLSLPADRASAATVAMTGAGRFTAAWSSRTAAGLDVLMRRFRSRGEPVAQPVRMPSSSIGDFTEPAIAADAAGNLWGVWVQEDRQVAPSSGDGDDSGLFGRRYGPSGQPVGSEFRINSQASGNPFRPDVALGQGGEAAVVWLSRPQPDAPELSIVLRQFAPPPCAAGGDVLCLGQGTPGRFQLAVDWRDFDHRTGRGRSLPLTEDTGAFWFFAPDNLEILAKVLDGRTINGHFWIFLSSLSNVEFTLTVTDTVTGRERQYHNPLGEFASVGDILALPSP